VHLRFGPFSGRDDAAIAQALTSMAQVLAQANKQAAVGHRDPG
jgi:hypothetical protein